MVVGDVDKVVVAVRFDPKVDMVVIAHRGGDAQPTQRGNASLRALLPMSSGLDRYP